MENALRGISAMTRLSLLLRKYGSCINKLFNEAFHLRNSQLSENSSQRSFWPLPFHKKQGQNAGKRQQWATILNISEDEAESLRFKTAREASSRLIRWCLLHDLHKPVSGIMFFFRKSKNDPFQFTQRLFRQNVDTRDFMSTSN